MTGTVRASLWLLLVIGLVASAAAPLAAQSDAGGVRVLVVDSSSAVIPGANVTLKNLETNTSDSRVSNDEGYAIFSPIPRGTYDVEVALDRFQTVRLRNISVDVQQNRLLRVTMEVAQRDRDARGHRTGRTGADGGGIARAGHQGDGRGRIAAGRRAATAIWRCSRPAPPTAC